MGCIVVDMSQGLRLFAAFGLGVLKLRCIAGGVPLGMGCARMPHFTSKKKKKLLVLSLAYLETSRKKKAFEESLIKQAK